MNTNTTKTKRLNGFSHYDIGDDHLYTGLETPIKKDAFLLSDEEKKKKNIHIIRRNYECYGFRSRR